MSGKLLGLQKQNDSIFFSLLTRKIDFVRSVVPEGTTEEEHIKILIEENARLKEVIKANKPEPVIKEVVKTELPETKPEIKPKNTNQDEEQDESFEEPVKKFETIGNMEELKRAFFNGLYDEFETHVKACPYKFYTVEYKYNSDKDGAPDFSAKNLLKGFVRNFDDYRKYFMICFRCWKDPKESKYKYSSLWIVNTNEPVRNIIGSFADDFEFVESFDTNNFLHSIKKIENIEETQYIGESYVH